MGFDFSKLVIKHYSYPEIRRIAESLRADTILDWIPVDIDLLAEKHLGLQLTPIPSLIRTTGCEAFLTNKLDEIVFEESQYPYRTRFSIAHEIGHLKLHTDIIQQLRPASLEDWFNMTTAMPPTIWGKIENEANNFADHLLIPMKTLEQEILKLKPELEFAKEMEDLESINLFIATTLSSRFEVSELTLDNFLKNNSINAYEIIK